MSTFQTWFKALRLGVVLVAGFIALTLGAKALNALFGKNARGMIDRVQMWWSRSVCDCLNVRRTILGVPHASPGMVACNHISWLDILILGGLYPVTFVAKSEIREWPVFGPMAYNIGTLFIQRGNSSQTRAVAERMAWCLRQGRTLGLFPEGTTTTGSIVLKFHARLFQAACLNSATVQAIGIAYHGAAREFAPFVGDDALVPHLWQLLKLPEIDVTLHFCEPLEAGQFARDQLAELTRQQIMDAIGLNPHAINQDHQPTEIPHSKQA